MAMEEMEENTAPPPRQVPQAGRQPNRVQVILAACGIAGPVLYASVVIVLGFLRPGYDHLTQVISELGEVGAPNAIVMNIFGFVLPSLLIFAFAIGLYRGIRDGRAPIVASALLAVGALGFVGAALFPCSPGCDPGTSASHFMGGAIGVGLLLAPFAFWLTLRKDSRWQGYDTYSLVTGVLVLALFTVGFSGMTRPWDGLGQRVWTGILFLWIVVMAVHLLRLSLWPKAEDVPGR